MKSLRLKFLVYSGLIFMFLFQGFQIQAQEKNDPVLLSLGGKDITRTEFEKIYRKNNSKEASSDKKSLQDYLDLYVNYKLKVREAEELSLDTASSFRNELSGYRKQLAQPYLTDKDMSEKLVKEAYSRMQKDIRASHILIKVTPDALPKDTLKAFNRAMKIRDLVMKSNDFAKVARDSSEDPSAKENNGDLGYFTALQMVYAFEDAAYRAKEGEISMPVRTRFGYHLIKVTGSRVSQGEVTVAHIMIKAGAKISAQDSMAAKNKIDDIYNKIKAGQSFEDQAKSMSEDPGSAKNGGVLPSFGTGRMVPEFEQAAFSLKNKGDISAPIKTAYGWHIIKMIDKKMMPPFEEVQGDIKSKISKDARSEMGRSSFIAKTKKEYRFQDFPKAKDELSKFVDSTLADGSWTVDKTKGADKTLFSLLDKNFTQADFARYMADHQTKRKGVEPMTLMLTYYDKFLEESVINFKEAQLEKEYPDFKALMEEYRDGILLFELTDKKVWSKAVKDSIGLKSYYDANKSKYMWTDRTDADIFTCMNASVAKKVKKLTKKNNSYESIEQSVNQELNNKNAVQAKAGRFVKGDNEFLDSQKWEHGIIVVKRTNSDTVMVVNFREVLAAQPKTLEECKGLVTADYQAVLEKEWIESLRKKYAVKVNSDVLKTIR